MIPAPQTPHEWRQCPGQELDHYWLGSIGC